MKKKIINYFKIDKEQIVPYCLYIISPLVSFALLEFLNENINIFRFNVIQFFMNLIIYYMVYFIFLTLVRRVHIASYIGFSFFMIYALINSFVQQFRGNPILPFDIYSIRTAMNVAGEYKFSLNVDQIIFIVLSILYFALMMIIFHLSNVKKIRPFGRNNLLAIVLIVCVHSLYFSKPILAKYGITVDVWDQAGAFKRNGVALSLMDNSSYMTIKKPTNYNSAILENDLDKVVPSENMYNSISDTEVKNIIVIMNESFSDLSVVGDFRTNVDYLSYYHSLDAIKGYVYSSIYGGATANSEFEYLTGDSIGLLPNGAMTYTMYMKNGITSLVDILKNNGYYSTAIHTYWKSGYNREKTYDILGFDEKYFLDDYELQPKDYVRVYPSDQFTYSKVIEQLDNSNHDKNFVFCVTMQNHGGYFFEGVDQDVELDLDENERSQYKDVEQYLSSLNSSDQALKNLVDHYKDSDEPTLIIQFGDHQPRLGDEFYSKLYGKDTSNLSLEETQRKYMTPYLMWANYPIDTSVSKNMSINYLSTMTLQVANIQLPKYNQFLKTLYLKYPVISAIGVIDSQGNQTTLDSLKEDEMINLYERLQYNNLFDIKHKDYYLFTGNDEKEE